MFIEMSRTNGQIPPTSYVLPLQTLISNWVHSCTTYHKNPGCALPTTSWLPTRLVDIGIRTDGHHPCLVATEGLPQADLPYIALSHTSNDEFESLTSANIDRWLESLPLDELAPLFPSACLVTEVLGY